MGWTMGCFGPVWIDWEYESDGSCTIPPVHTQDRTILAVDSRVMMMDRSMKHVCSYSLPHPPTGGFATIGKSVFVVSWGGTAVLMNDDCQVLWQRQLGDRPRGSPAIYKDTVLVGLHHGEVRALNVKTGRDVWNFSTEYPLGHARLAVYEKLFYIGDQAGNVYAIDTPTGLLKWSHRMPGPVEAGVVEIDGNVIVGDTKGTMMGLSRRDGVQLWKHQAAGGMALEGLNVDGVFVAATQNRTLEALDARTGRLLAKLNLPGVPVGSPQMWDGQVIVATQGNGAHLVGVRPDDWRLEWRERFRSAVLLSSNTSEAVTRSGRYFRLRPGLHWIPIGTMHVRVRMSCQV